MNHELILLPKLRHYCQRHGAQIVVRPGPGSWYATVQTSPDDDGAPVASGLTAPEAMVALEAML